MRSSRATDSGPSPMRERHDRQVGEFPVVTAPLSFAGSMPETNSEPSSLHAVAPGAAPPHRATFTLMKRFVNRVSVVWHAGITKDCRHAIGRLPVRAAVARHRPPRERGGGVRELGPR